MSVLHTALFICLISCSQALRCYDCSHVDSVADCAHVTYCGVHEQCYVQRSSVSGQDVFMLGCRNMTLCGVGDTSVTWGTCCTDDYCNINYDDAGHVKVKLVVAPAHDTVPTSGMAYFQCNLNSALNLTADMAWTFTDVHGNVRQIFSTKAANPPELFIDVKNVSTSDAGTYTCHATMGKQVWTSSGTLLVADKSQTQNTTSPIASNPTQWKLKTIPSSQTVHRGDTAVILCEMDPMVDHAMEMTWTFLNSSGVSTDIYSDTEPSPSMTFYVKEAQRSDVGVYTCQAKYGANTWSASSHLLVALLLALFTLVLPHAAGLRCYKCQAMASPSDCTYIEACSPEQHCSVRKYTDDTGRASFDLGCTNLSTCVALQSNLSVVRLPGEKVLWDRCCDHDFCNLDYDEAGTHTAPTDLRCFSCSNIHSPAECRYVKTCNPGNSCMTYSTPGSRGGATYILGCRSKQSCDHTGGLLIGRRDTHRCKQCCSHASLCNNQLCATTSTTTTSTSTTSSSTTSTTTTSTTTTSTTTTSTTTTSTTTTSISKTSISKTSTTTRSTRTTSISTKITPTTITATTVRPTTALPQRHLQIVPHNATLVVGDNATFICTLDSPVNITVNMAWSFLDSAHRIHDLYGETVNQAVPRLNLDIQSVALSDIGVYFCSAKIVNQTWTAEAVLNVHEQDV